MHIVLRISAALRSLSSVQVQPLDGVLVLMLVRAVAVVVHKSWVGREQGFMLALSKQRPCQVWELCYDRPVKRLDKLNTPSGIDAARRGTPGCQ